MAGTGLALVILDKVSLIADVAFPEVIRADIAVRDGALLALIVDQVVLFHAFRANSVAVARGATMDRTGFAGVGIDIVA